MVLLLSVMRSLSGNHITETTVDLQTETVYNVAMRAFQFFEHLSENQQLLFLRVVVRRYLNIRDSGEREVLQGEFDELTLGLIDDDGVRHRGSPL